MDTGSEQCPKMLKMAFIVVVFFLNLGLFLKILRWVPL